MKSILQQTFVKTFLVFLLMMSFVDVDAQTTVSYTAMTTITCPATPVATISAPPTGLTFSQFSRGAGVTCSAAGGSISGSGFNNTLANNITNSKWYTFSITSDASTSFTLNSLSIVSRVSSITGAPTVSVQYSIGAGAKTAIGTYTPTTSAATYTITPGAAIAVGSGQVLNIFVIPVGLTAGTTTCRVENNTSANVTASAAGPTVTTTAATAITTTTATLNGTINANGVSTAASFDYGLSTTYSNNTAGTPSPITGSTSTAISGSASGLTANTQYNFRAVGTVSAVNTNGSNLTFYTLANVPNAPTVLNPTTSSLDVTIGSGDGNPANTTYAIQVNAGNYVQADGSVGATAVYQTAAIWGTKTVTGLTSDTPYSFRVYAKNGGNVVTNFGATTTLSTAPIITPSLTGGLLTGFGNVCVNTSSTPNSFTLTGSNLDGSAVTVGPLSGYTFDNGSGYGSTVVISGYGTAISTSINVIFTPSLVQSYNGNIPVSGGGAPSINVAASGTGVNTPATVTTGSSSSITTTTATLTGTITAGCSSVTSSGIAYSLNSDMSASTQVANPSNLSGLAANTQYYYRAFANDGTGTVNGAILNFTTLGLTTPVATAATLVNQNDFTANWNALDGATSYRLDVSTSPTFGITTPTTGLFFSEYGEGSTGNKKYVEIYNGTGAAVNLANYQLWKNVNGSNWNFNSTNTTATLPLSLSGTLANGATYVIANNATDVIGANLYNTFLSFNGDDATGLAYNGGSGTVFTLIDVVGIDGVDPGSGWAVAGTANATVDKILIRKPTILSPNTNWAASAGTSVSNSEWIVSSFTYSTTTQTTNLGAHSINNVTPSFVSGYYNLTVSGTSQLVSGLNASTPYYYRVRGFSINSLSANSNVITVTTAALSPTFDSVSQVMEDVCDNSNATFNVNGLLASSTSTISYSINGVAQTPITNVVANGSGFATFNVLLTVANNGQVLAITQIERTDIVSPILTLSSGNSVTISGVLANVTYYADLDGDTFGDINNPVLSCSGQPAQTATNSTDCDDTNGLIYQSSLLYVDADNDGFYNGNPTAVSVCYGATPPSGYTSNILAADCDDNNFEVNPGHVEVLNNGIDDNCSGTEDETLVVPTSFLYPSVCGTTMSSFYQVLYAYQVAGAEGYRFEITNGSTKRTIDNTLNNFTFAQLTGTNLYATAYSVRVAVKMGGFFRAYGTPCVVNSPLVPSTSSIYGCGSTLASFWSTIYASPVAAATGYRFRVTNGSNVRTFDTTVSRFSLAQLTGTNLYGTTYTVEVALRFGTTWAAEYSPACNFTTTATPPTTKVVASQCGITISNLWATIYANPSSDAVSYRFEVVNGAQTRFFDTPNPRFSLQQLAGGAAANTVYTVRVAIFYGGVYQAFGTPCTITTSPTATRGAATDLAIFEANAYPNPFADTFKLDINTSSEDTVEVKVYDMIGKLVERRNISLTELGSQEVGSRYLSGVYNIVVTQGENVKTLRVIKR